MDSSKKYSFEIGPIRPPSEGSDQSLLIRATRNCPWNKCLFCRTYRGKKFELRSVEEIKRDIDAASAICDKLKAQSWKMGLGGQITNELLRNTVQANPELYHPNTTGIEAANENLSSLGNVANWLVSGAKTVFLQDANTLIMRTPDLLEVLQYLKQTFLSIERITSYARSHTASHKSLAELQELHEAGLSRLHIGMESGCDEVLEFIRKGVTVADHVSAGQKIVQSGISLSEYVIPGLGGNKWSQKHAIDTALALNQINPDFIRLRSLIVRRGTDLYEKFQSGEFEPPYEDEIIEELRLFIENLNCHGYLVSDHMANLLWEIEGQLPGAKERLLKIISEYQAKPVEERMEMQLKRRLHSYLAVHGGMDKELEQTVQKAFQSIESSPSEMQSQVQAALNGLKQAAM